MDTAKIRVKIGSHEFEAEGPAAQVSEQFEAWKELIASFATPDKTSTNIPPANSTGLSAGVQLTLESFNPEQLGHIYNQDEKRDLVTLRVFPTGDDRHKEAVLLILYGYLRLRKMDEVVVTKLKASLESSGPAPDRIDRVAIPSQREGYLIKSGSGKGGKYRLTNRGTGKAEEMIRELLVQLT